MDTGVPDVATGRRPRFPRVEMVRARSVSGKFYSPVLTGAATAVLEMAAPFMCPSIGPA
jgi:hypothetical protein